MFSLKIKNKIMRKHLLTTHRTSVEEYYILVVAPAPWKIYSLLLLVPTQRRALEYVWCRQW
jgi:hypothetical protein